MKYSIIVPVFNAERYLKSCLSSLVSQSLDASLFEIVLVDDGSLDASKEICQQFTPYENVTYYYKNNGGPSSARNYGIGVSRGEYILFVDSDDWCEQDFLQSIDDRIEDNDFLVHGYFVETQNGSVACVPPGDVVHKEDILRFSNRVLDLDGSSFFSAPWIGVFKRSILLEKTIRFNEELSFGEDTCFVYDYLCQISSLVCLEKPLYHYNNVNESSITKRFVANRYPLCLIRFQEREKIYSLYGKTSKAEVQFCKLLTVETNNCVRNVLLAKDYDVQSSVTSFMEILNDSYIRKRYGKKLLRYGKCGKSFYLTVIYLKVARAFKSKALLRLFSKKCIRRLNRNDR